MSYRELPAPPALGLWAECVWEHDGEESSGATARVVPDGCMDLVWSERRGLLVAGPNTTAFVAASAPGTVWLGVRLHPGAGPPLFGVPAPALLDARVPVRDLWGARGARLEEVLFAASGGARRTCVLLDWLAARAERAARPDPLVRQAVRALALRPERRIGALARELAVSERHLRRHVVAEVGYGPKLLGRVLRLRRALADVRRGLPLAEVAHAGGYADQAHFAGDCRALAGAAPSAFRGDDVSVFSKTRGERRAKMRA